ncbi:MAG: hypothetical protein IPH82_26285 [Chloroflexi bacterium]|nr:hypothetical protein [Chloroflexota bacterium]
MLEARQANRKPREAARLLDSHSSITIGGARDVRRPVDNAERGFTLPAEELLDIRSTLVAARTLQRNLLKAEETFPRLAEIAELIEERPGLVQAISQTLDERGEVLTAPALNWQNWQELRVVHGRIQEKLQRILQSSQNQYLQDRLRLHAQRPLRRPAARRRQKDASKASSTTRAAAQPMDRTGNRRTQQRISRPANRRT